SLLPRRAGDRAHHTFPTRRPSDLGARREFFRRTVAAYRRYLPPAGYPAPRGIGWIKHRLVRHNAYWTWAVLRLVWRTTRLGGTPDRKSTRLNSSHVKISYAVFCLK